MSGDMVRLLVTAGLAILSMVMLLVLAQGLNAGADDRGRLAVKAERSAPAESEGLAVLRRDKTGQFHVTAAVNGVEGRFLVDTGADVVALSPEDADAMGVAFDAAAMGPILQTATGPANGVVASIDRLEVAGQELHDVPVAVVEGLDKPLLGQSALRKLGRVSLKGDRLIIGG